MLEMTVWLLQHKQIIQLHTYVYIVPTTASLDDSLSSEGQIRNSRDHTPVTTPTIMSDTGSVKSQDEYSKRELLNHLSPEERRSVLNTSAAADEEDLEEFAR